MGKLKERLTTTITADLVQWVDRGKNTFAGTVYFSICKQYQDDSHVRITFSEVVHYPAINDYWTEHWLGRTEQGLYFKMEEKHRLRLRT